ncbi:inorganic phosphate transporter [Paenarthrobacter sp. PH39-S1]|uniref:inorganic phosphate transporter n=1 Tax=Paenarthrobacter sp. PH39-S1 TaxID=3046204 RepID=UPI0024B90D37|nr:inorganic phosphate transporter [Paenarthrobacter sp. PH39-S1]MDJ0354964.1 inorganic phosphate transporter [Paenarthrobacter sp. PH39-S1]
MATAFLLVVVILAAGFAFLNGFRDASSAVAIAVRNRSLTPSIAVLLAGFFNLAGALLSGSFAVAVGGRLFSLPRGTAGLALLAAALTAACLWGVYQWRRGYPSSSTHALIGGLAGASSASTLVGEQPLHGLDSTLLTLVVLPLLLSPVVAFALSFLTVYPAVWASRHSQPSFVNRRVRRVQAVGTAAVAFGHGLQDAQRTTTVLLLALAAAGLGGTGAVPAWVLIFSAVLLAAGTLTGGWRVSYTLGSRLAKIDPMRGMVAQLVSSVLLFIGAIGLHLPLSTTHTVTSSIIGAGLNQRFSVTNGRLWLRILRAWVATPIAAAVLGAILYLAVSPLI